MVPATNREIKDAFAALKRICAETRFSAAVAWRVVTLLSVLRPIVERLEVVQLKLYKDAGGIERGNGIDRVQPERADGETEGAFFERMSAFTKETEHLASELRALFQASTTVDCEPLSIATLGEGGAKFNANDLAACGPFLTE